jgi:hypothetical protein
MQGLVLMGLAAFCGIWALRADDKLLRWFLIAACLLNLIGGFVVAQEGKFWKWAPGDRRDDADYHQGLSPACPPLPAADLPNAKFGGERALFLLLAAGVGSISCS